MKKNEFLAALRQTLSVLPQQELEKQLTYYDEMIADMMEDGMTEEDAVAKIGDPAEIGRSILADMPNPPPASGPMKPPQKVDSNKTSFWVIFALILGFPVWFSVATALFAVVIAILATVFALVIAMVAVVIGLFFGGLGLIVASFFTVGASMPAVILLIGTGLLLMGLSLLSSFGVYYLGKGFGFLVKKTGQLCSKPFKKEGSK